jgi:molybdopterin synthase catalytic subunit
MYYLENPLKLYLLLVTWFVIFLFRLGIVPVMEASVVIAVSSPHRAESLQAVQYAIHTLKSSTPIWKKEVYVSEEAEWKENKECAWRST